MALTLIGIISSLAIGLFTGRSVFIPLLASQQLSSATLLAQQAALAGNESDAMTISQDADRFVFTVGPGTSSQRQFEIARVGASLTVSAGSVPHTVSFNPDGTTTTSSIQFTFSGDSTTQVCLSSLGAVYTGEC